MNSPDDQSRVVQPNYMLPALLLTGLGYHIAFNIAEQPDTPNAFIVKIIGLATIGVFGTTFLVGLRKLLPSRPATNLKATSYKQKAIKTFTKH
ncbi:MAG: hypothetical protein ACLGH8_06710 [Bacteroidia bacterium]